MSTIVEKLEVKFNKTNKHNFNWFIDLIKIKWWRDEDKIINKTYRISLINILIFIEKSELLIILL